MQTKDKYPVDQPPCIMCGAPEPDHDAGCAVPAQHAPGPWQIHRTEIIATDARSISDSVCEMNTTLPQLSANARLIAAAPDLLAALKLSPHRLADIACGRDWVCACAFCRPARAAVARAEGR